MLGNEIESKSLNYQFLLSMHSQLRLLGLIRLKKNLSFLKDIEKSGILNLLIPSRYVRLPVLWIIVQLYYFPLL